MSHLDCRQKSRPWLHLRFDTDLMARSKVYKAKPKRVEEELPSDDEIDAFDKQKDFVSLDQAQESESDDVDDEGLYDLSDDEQESDEDDEVDSDDSDAEGGSLARRKPAA